MAVVGWVVASSWVSTSRAQLHAKAWLRVKEVEHHCELGVTPADDGHGPPAARDPRKRPRPPTTSTNHHANKSKAQRKTPTTSTSDRATCGRQVVVVIAVVKGGSGSGGWG